MIRRALYLIAGVDRETIETCPATDRLWAAQLGFSLCLSFVVVLGIAFHATGYMVPDLFMRSIASLVIALTVFMFDRALYQSDWFYQGFLWRSGPGGDDNAGGARSARRFLRIGIRLAMSFGLAWVIAVFLELAIFSDTISDKIKRDHITINQPVYQKIEQYEAQLNAEIEQRRSALASLETLLRSELAGVLAGQPSEPAPVEDFEQQIRSLDAQEVERRSELRQIQESIKTYAADMNAEELGQRLNAANSGRVGAGPRFQFAKRQKEVYEEQRIAKETEIAQLQVRRNDLRSAQARITGDAESRRKLLREANQSRRETLQTQADVARADLRQREISRLSNVEEFRRKALTATDFQKQKDDPLSRMTAYQELKSDPKDGATITLFSWMTKFLIIFLEIVPIVAKLFFSPPSVYATKIQIQVERERRRAQREWQQSVETESDVEHMPRPVLPKLQQGGETVSNNNNPEPQSARSSGDLSKSAKAERSSPLSVTQKVGNRRPAKAQEQTLEQIEAQRRREMDGLIGEKNVKLMNGSAGRQGVGEPASPPRLLRPMTSLDVVVDNDNSQKS